MLSAESSLLVNLLQTVTKQQANAEFFFFGFGGSGALGLGFAQVPKLLKENENIKSRKGAASLGGEDLRLNPLASLQYPESIKAKDIEKIISSFPTMEKIQSMGEKKSYMSQLGYLERDAFDKSLPQCNPLARYAVFDALSLGGGDMASPLTAAELVASWKGPQGLSKFSGDLLAANAKKFSAYGVFLFLIALVIDLIVESGRNAFF